MMGLLIGVLVFGTGAVDAQTVRLDNAITGAVEELSYNLKKDSKIVILSMRAGSARMSNYLVEELTLAIESQRFFTVVDRNQLNQVRQEMNLPISGEVSDSSAQAIGQKTGAQAIVTGTFDQTGNYYRFRVRVIDVATAAVLVTYSSNVQNDQVVASLMGSSGSGSASSSAPAAAASDDENYTIGQRWGTWALNAFVLPGLGSYVIMRDPFGGTFQLLTGVTSLALYIAGYATMANATYTENVVYGYGSYSYTLPQTKIDEGKRTGGTVMVVIGSLLATTNFIFNIVRSAAHDKPQPEVGSLADPNAWSLVILPGANGVETVQLAYTLRY